ncbi:hypothetical protein [Stackebrandtia albiflava]|uniref:hypothetical protein n=1 Tax=Stackebrandtia albiflava TaxID=406432 RepID=UPI0011BF69D9|nr:hypothetical protein [Stackebrandtia albiflava]
MTIRYTGVVEYTAAAYGTEWWGSRRPGPVQLDEVLPHEAGCRHDIALIGGRVRVVAADLRAEWGGAARG